jgi:hypothetical protein
MLKHRSFIIALIIMVPLALPGQQEYREVTDALTRLITVQENYIGVLKTARKGSDVALAMKDLSGAVRELGAVFTGLDGKYPGLFSDEKKISPEIRVLMASSEKVSRRLSEITLISLYRYGAEPEVGQELERLKEMLTSFLTRPAK